MFFCLSINVDEAHVSRYFVVGEQIWVSDAYFAAD